MFDVYQMTKTTYQQTIREIGNSKYILVPSDFVNHASLENGKQYKVTLEEIEEERDE
jgi:antitoxin component of MazEF toxin-antitoxin module